MLESRDTLLEKKAYFVLFLLFQYLKKRTDFYTCFFFFLSSLFSFVLQCFELKLQGALQGTLKGLSIGGC